MSEFTNQPSSDDSDLSVQSEIEKIMFSFQIAPPEIIPDNQEFLANNIIGELADCLVEEPKPTLPKINPVNIYDFPVVFEGFSAQERNREEGTENKKEENVTVDQIEPLISTEPIFSNVNQDLERENEQLKAKIKEFESVQENPETELLLNQLEIAQTTIKNQQLMIETLSRQLAETQEHLSNLERECSQAQDNYNQQTYKLLETEKQLQELHGRLLRQQRYTLEYKTVLEECFKESSATILLANKSLTKQQVNESLIDQHQQESVTHKPIKSHWPSPGIDNVTESTVKKIKKVIDLPTFI